MIKLVIPCLLFGGLLSCSGPNKESSDSGKTEVKRLSRLESPVINTRVRMGDSVAIKFSADSVQIDSLVVSTAEGPVKLLNGEKLMIHSGRVGSRRYTVEVYMHGQVENQQIRIKILPASSPKSYTYQIIQTYPHSIEDYTQGFLYRSDTIYESTGQKGESVIKKYLLSSGRLIKSVPIDDRYFGEGCTIWKDKLYQLTWEANTGFIYDRDLNLKQEIKYATEGWGLTTIGDTLYMTDGSANIYLIDPNTFAQLGRFEVWDHNGPVKDLNELEVVQGLIYANVYPKDEVVIIDPISGAVVGRANLSGLLSLEEQQGADVLNGIAYDVVNDRLFFTGKHWPKTFELKLIEK